MGPQRNAELLVYFRDRRAWLMDVKQQKLTELGAAAGP
jgi:hypothetical protein